MKTAAKVFISLDLAGAILNVLLSIVASIVFAALKITLVPPEAIPPDAMTPEVEQVVLLLVNSSQYILFGVDCIIGLAYIILHSTALRIVSNADCHKDVVNIGIILILFGALISGILTLCITEKNINKHKKVAAAA